MRAVRQRDTDLEVSLRSALFKRGLRFRKNDPLLAGHPDIVFRSARVAVFVHGCFWHAHKKCRLATLPKSNVEFWQAKFRANRRRDKQKARLLESTGWRVLVVWGCEIRSDLAVVASRIDHEVRSRSAITP